MEVKLTDTTNQHIEEPKKKSPTPTPYMGKDRGFESKQEITKEADALRSTETSNEELPKKTTGTEHDYKKRYDDLKSHYDTKLSTWRKEKEEILTQIKTNKKTKEVMPKTTEEIKKLKQEKPEVNDRHETITTRKKK